VQLLLDLLDVIGDGRALRSDVAAHRVEALDGVQIRVPPARATVDRGPDHELLADGGAAGQGHRA
jgi:hypothetical protein